MDISSTGFSNEDLTMRVEDFVDRLLKVNESADPALWETFPPLVAASSGIIVFELWRRYRAGTISFDNFRNLTLKTVGLKAGKYAVLLGALSVPGLNVVVGAYLLGSLILAVGSTVDMAPNFKPFSFLAARKRA